MNFQLTSKSEPDHVNGAYVERYGEPENMAPLVIFIASLLAGYISDTVIPIDGGLRRYQF